MQTLMSFLFIWFGAVFGVASYIDAEPVMAGFGAVMVLIGIGGFFMKER